MDLQNVITLECAITILVVCHDTHCYNKLGSHIYVEGKYQYHTMKKQKQNFEITNYVQLHIS